METRLKISRSNTYWFMPLKLYLFTMNNNNKIYKIHKKLFPFEQNKSYGARNANFIVSKTNPCNKILHYYNNV